MLSMIQDIRHLGTKFGNAVVLMVVDFLDFHLNDLHCPSFNIADSALSVGILIFVYHLIFKKMPE